jgi:hypothetical protein
MDTESAHLVMDFSRPLLMPDITISLNFAVLGCPRNASYRVQPAGRGLEVLVGRAEGVGGMDAAVKPTWR